MVIRISFILNKALSHIIRKQLQLLKYICILTSRNSQPGTKTVVTPHIKPFLLSTDYIMNYASDVTGMFIHGNVHIKMLKLLKVFKRL